MPSGVVVADMLEGIRFCARPAVAFRRDALDAIGGIAATADYYSDDYVPGNKIWEAGYKVIFLITSFITCFTPRPSSERWATNCAGMKKAPALASLGPSRDRAYLRMPFACSDLLLPQALGNLRLAMA